MTSSLDFSGNMTSYIDISYSSVLDLGLEDFTIEWYQYETDTNTFPRPFSRGSYPTATVAVSMESPSFYYWANGDSTNHSFPFSKTPNRWVHFAIVRNSGSTTIYYNGISQISFADSYNYDCSDNLIIGNESVPGEVAAFGGYMYYFSMNKGYARYTQNFTVNNNYPPILPSTVIMVNADGSYGTLGSTIAYPYNNITTVPIIPSQPPPTPSPQPFFRMVGSVNSDNSRVYYKPHSLSWSVGSTVRNSRAVSKRT
jgi:hypothetical protein